MPRWNVVAPGLAHPVIRRDAGKHQKDMDLQRHNKTALDNLSRDLRRYASTSAQWRETDHRAA
jgi:hypothetical protein